MSDVQVTAQFLRLNLLVNPDPLGIALCCTQSEHKTPTKYAYCMCVGVCVCDRLGFHGWNMMCSYFVLNPMYIFVLV